ncbi:hypothetical protein ACHAQA_003790 [Verticillium albo-atrum]
MHTLVQPNEWVAVKLPNESIRILQVIPNTTVSLGKYGSFPSNLIIERPYHLTYEVQDRRDDENFNRLRVVPASEIHADVIAEENGDKPVPDETGDAETERPAPPTNVMAVEDGADFTLVDKDSGAVIAREGRATIEAEARQLLTQQEIETLKKSDTDGGKDIIAKLLLSHTSLDEKTSWSLAKYKILKNKKYLRRFSIQPLYPSTLGQFILEEKEPNKIMEMRQESLALLGCWGHVHFGGEEIENTPKVVVNDGNPVIEASQLGGRWLVVDDTGGLVVASMAERMGILHQDLSQHNATNGLAIRATSDRDGPQSDAPDSTPAELTPADTPAVSTPAVSTPADDTSANPENANGNANGPPYPTRTYRGDFEIDLASSNTITLLHSANQPNLALLKYWNCDMANPSPTTSSHPLANRLFPLSWLQLMEPESDTTYSSYTPDIPEEELREFKASRRGNYHRKRRRWARTRFIIDQARAGGFSGLVVASTMDPISIVRAALPLLAGGAPISIYSPTIEPLTQLADCFSKPRRAAWSANPPTDANGAPIEDLENWPGSDDFPVNPALLIAPNVQTSRAKRWQVLPGRTHPLMMGRGGAEGFLFTGSKAVPAEGKIEARGKFKRRKVDA